MLVGKQTDTWTETIAWNVRPWTTQGSTRGLISAQLHHLHHPHHPLGRLRHVIYRHQRLQLLSWWAIYLPLFDSRVVFRSFGSDFAWLLFESHHPESVVTPTRANTNSTRSTLELRACAATVLVFSAIERAPQRVWLWLKNATGEDVPSCGRPLVGKGYGESASQVIYVRVCVCVCVCVLLLYEIDRFP